MSPSTTLELFFRARESLADAYAAAGTAQRHLAARTAALRAAAAVVAARGGGLGGRLSDPWVLLVRLAPELAEWADYFSVVAQRGAELTASRAPVGAREADDLLRAAESFIDQICPLLGLPPTGELDRRLVSVQITTMGGPSGLRADACHRPA